MGSDVLVVYKVYLEDLEKIDEVSNKLKEVSTGEFKDLKREPIGFGIEVIKVGYVIPDKVEGALNKLEEDLRNIEGISDIECEATTLL